MQAFFQQKRQQLSTFAKNTNEKLSSSMKTISNSDKHRLQNISRIAQNVVVSQLPIPCCYCDSLLTMVGPYRCHPFFPPTERACITHTTNEMPKCLSCGRFQPKRKPFQFVEFGTPSQDILCQACARTAVIDNPNARNIYIHVLQFFKDQGLHMYNGKMERILI